MSVIWLWRGYHGPEFRALFASAFARGELLIACPPAPVDASFLAQLPEGEPRFVGDWSETPALPKGPRPVYPERPVLGVFTTGTTSTTQKLVLYSRANIVSSSDAIWGLYDERRIGKIYCYPQPYHVFGLLLGYALATRKGIELVTHPGPYARAAHAAWLAAVDENTLTLATPSHMNDLCLTLATEGRVPAASYSVILGGAKVNLDVWRVARAVARIEQPSVGYGCTEASPGISHLPPGVEPLADGDVGWPLPSVRLGFSLDPGGFWIEGPSVCLATVDGGVLSFPKRHQVRDELVPLGQERLGFAGRHDMVLNRGGEKFPLERIEAVLKQTLGVDAICVALPDARLGEELGVVAQKGSGASLEDMHAMLAKEFQRRFDFGRMTEVERLPLNANAKPDRRAARDLLGRKDSAT